MIYEYPRLETQDQHVLGLIREQRRRLQFQVSQNPVRWSGFLRKNTFARALQGSNSIEGINASLDEAVEIVDEGKPETLGEETLKALEGYRQAMTYIIRVHDDPYTKVDTQFIRSLHFMMMYYDMAKLPGQWRPGSVYVVHEATGGVVYQGPPAEQVPGLMDELVAQINATSVTDAAGNSDSATVRAAMAHLNLAMIHPFKDGNGRMARALQILVLSANGISSPTFCSIEEWLGRNTLEYYDILQKVGQGGWHPENASLPWVRFCLKAHYQQSATIMKRNEHIGRVWNEVSRIFKKHGLHERMEPSIVEAAFGFRVRNARYRAENQLSDVVAGRDLRKLCELNLLEPVGDKRGRYYRAHPTLRALALRTHDDQKAADPYAIAAQ